MRIFKKRKTFPKKNRKRPINRRRENHFQMSVYIFIYTKCNYQQHNERFTEIPQENFHFISLPENYSDYDASVFDSITQNITHKNRMATCFEAGCLSSVG